MFLCLTELFEIELFTCLKVDLGLHNLKWLICHKTKPNQTKPHQKITKKAFILLTLNGINCYGSISV